MEPARRARKARSEKEAGGSRRREGGVREIGERGRSGL